MANFGMIDRSVAFNPISAFPLDARSYFESYADALAAAQIASTVGDTNTQYYYGETVVVVENGVAQLYIIQPDKTLTEVGSKIIVDENAFELDEDGVLKLLGFADAEANAQLVKGADGKLSWVVPSTDTVDGMQTAIGTLQTEVGTLKTDVSTLQDDLAELDGAIDAANEVIDDLKEVLYPAENGEGGLIADVDNLEVEVDNIQEDISDINENITNIESKIGDPANSELNQEATGLYAALELKADKATTYTKTEVDTLIEQKVVAADHLRRIIVDDVDSIDKNADDALLYVYMAPSGLQEDDNKYYEYIVLELEDGERVIEKVGSWEVDLKDYAKNETLVNYATNVALGELANTVASNKTELADAIQAEEDRAKTAEKKNADDISDILGALEEVDAALELLSDGKANKDEVYTKDEVYNKDEVYTKDEVYNKDEVYDKSQTDAAIVKAVKDATGGESASAVLADLNAYKKAVNAEIWGNGELLDEELTSSVSRIDTLEENFANIADAEKNFIADVTADFTVNQARVLSLNDIAMSKVVGLDDTIGAVQAKVTSLDKLINGYEDEDGNQVVGLIEHLGVNYVKVADFNELVGEVNQLKLDNVDIKEDISELQDLLTWKEMPTV